MHWYCRRGDEGFADLMSAYDGQRIGARRSQVCRARISAVLSL